MTKPTERGRQPLGETLSLVAICLDTETSSQLKHFVDSTSLVQLRAELKNYLAGEEDASLVDQMKDLQPDICLVDFDLDREQATRTAERVHEAFGDTALFAISADAQPELIIRAMRCGCREYLVKPLDLDQMVEALARVGGRKKERKDQPTGQLLAFIGAKGGSGVTTLAIHVAAILAQTHGRKTLLVDLHTDLGDASLYLALKKHQYHFYDLAENTHRLDADLLQGYLVQHPSGLDVLPAPEGFDVARQTSRGTAVAQTLAFLRTRYEYVVVDCHPGLDDQNMAVVDQADQVYIVAQPEVPALRNVARYIDQLTQFQVPTDRVRVVINRHMKKGTISDAAIEKAIRKSIYWRIPNQYNEVMKTINTGDPLSLSSGSEFMRSLSGWAETLAGKPTPGAGKKKESKGLLGLFN
ncbi:MAG TPA: AAA family ATPase [Terriglobia bacterium]|nr:AAA family ATPase [Terriglobia bacterium]